MVTWRLMICIAQGDQGPERIHQDREKRTEEPACCTEDHYQEEQEERHHQVQAPNLSLSLHT